MNNYIARSPSPRGFPIPGKTAESCIMLKFALLLSVLPAVVVFSAGTASTTIIDSIEIERSNIFDYKLKYNYDPVLDFINELHSVTDEDIVRREFGFKPGDLFTVDKMRERESHLRRLGIFSEVRIDTCRISTDGMNISLTTVDKWSTFIPVYFNYTKEQLDFSVGFREINLLGRRVTLGAGIARKDGVFSGLSEIAEPRVLGTRGAIAAGVGFSGDHIGTWYLQLWRPYLFDEDRFSLGLRSSKSISPCFNYLENVIQEEWIRESDASCFYISGVPDPLFRLTAGCDFNHTTWEDEEVALEANTCIFFFNTTFNDYVYSKRKLIDKLGAIEEVATGWNLGLTIGAGSDFLEHNHKVGYAAGSFFTAFQGSRHYLTLSYEKSGFFSFKDNSSRELLDSAEIAGFIKHKNVNTLVFKAEYYRSDNLRGPGEFSLGGLNGLRGYPPHFFNGDSMIRVNIEERLLIFRKGKLSRVLFVPFFDMGTSWSGDIARFGTALGLGLRLGDMENLGVTTLRIDLVFPFGAESTPAISIGTAHYFSPIRSFVFNWPGLRYFENIEKD